MAWIHDQTVAHMILGENCPCHSMPRQLEHDVMNACPTCSKASGELVLNTDGHTHCSLCDGAIVIGWEHCSWCGTPVAL